MCNHFEVDYKRLRELVETTINQIDSSVSRTLVYDGTTKKRDWKLIAEGLDLLHVKKQLRARLGRKSELLLRICFFFSIRYDIHFTNNSKRYKN